MDVNITLLFQAAQFFCVYFFLYKFLFIPASKILDEEEEFKNRLYKNLEHEQEIKDVLLQDYYAKNNNFKEVLLANIPEQATEINYQKSSFKSMSYDIDQDLLSSSDLETIEIFLVDRLSKVIKK